MSFFKEIANDLKKEIEAAQAEYSGQSGIYGVQGIAKQSTPDSGIIEYSAQNAMASDTAGRVAGIGHATGSGRTTGSGRSQTKKTRKKSSSQQQQKQAAVTPQSKAATPQTQVVVSVSNTRSIVAGLNAQKARNAIVLAEVLGSPVSARRAGRSGRR
jgi:hypothetical protein